MQLSAVQCISRLNRLGWSPGSENFFIIAVGCGPLLCRHVPSNIELVWEALFCANLTLYAAPRGGVTQSSLRGFPDGTVVLQNKSKDSDEQRKSKITLGKARLFP